MHLRLNTEATELIWPQISYQKRNDVCHDDQKKEGHTIKKKVIKFQSSIFKRIPLENGR